MEEGVKGRHASINIDSTHHSCTESEPRGFRGDERPAGTDARGEANSARSQVVRARDCVEKCRPQAQPRPLEMDACGERVSRRTARSTAPAARHVVRVCRGVLRPLAGVVPQFDQALWEELANNLRSSSTKQGGMEEVRITSCHLSGRETKLPRPRFILELKTKPMSTSRPSSWIPDPGHEQQGLSPGTDQRPPAVELQNHGEHDQVAQTLGLVGHSVRVGCPANQELMLGHRSMSRTRQPLRVAVSSLVTLALRYLLLFLPPAPLRCRVGAHIVRDWPINKKINELAGSGYRLRLPPTTPPGVALRKAAHITHRPKWSPHRARQREGDLVISTWNLKLLIWMPIDSCRCHP